MDDGFFGDVQGQFTAPGTDDVLAKLDFVSGKNLDAFPTPRNGHIPLLVVGCGLHGGIGEQDVIYRLALGGVGGCLLYTSSKRPLSAEVCKRLQNFFKCSRYLTKR